MTPRRPSARLDRFRLRLPLKRRPIDSSGLNPMVQPPCFYGLETAVNTAQQFWLHDRMAAPVEAFCSVVQSALRLKEPVSPTEVASRNRNICLSLLVRMGVEVHRFSHKTTVRRRLNRTRFGTSSKAHCQDFDDTFVYSAPHSANGTSEIVDGLKLSIIDTKPTDKNFPKIPHQIQVVLVLQLAWIVALSCWKMKLASGNHWRYGTRRCYKTGSLRCSSSLRQTPSRLVLLH
uniref:Calponin-homology (CH) domain-containing protein n=1 Tax=Heterorhabditis bacteriophora TaxID=37862 RepID=A0A1I7WSG6_HETBA